MKKIRKHARKLGLKSTIEDEKENVPLEKHVKKDDQKN